MPGKRLIDIAYLSVGPVCMDQLIKEFAAVPSRFRNAEHPEITVGFGELPRINRRKVGRELIIDFFPINQLPAFGVQCESNRTTCANVRKQTWQHLVLIVDWSIEFDDVYYQPHPFLKTIDQMQTVATTNRHHRQRISGIARDDQ